MHFIIAYNVRMSLNLPHVSLKLCRASKNKIDDVPRHTHNKLIFWDCQEKTKPEEFILLVVSDDEKEKKKQAKK